MARGRGLPATYIKQAGGDLKKAWQMYRSRSRVKKAKRGGSMPKKRARTVRRAPRRRYVRRIARGSRIKRAIRGLGGITGIAGGIAAANQLGVFDAINRVVSSPSAEGLQAAANELQSRATFGNLVAAVGYIAVPQLGKALVRGFGVRLPWWL